MYRTVRGVRTHNPQASNTSTSRHSKRGRERTACSLHPARPCQLCANHGCQLRSSPLCVNDPHIAHTDTQIDRHRRTDTYRQGPWQRAAATPSLQRFSANPTTHVGQAGDAHCACSSTSLTGSPDFITTSLLSRSASAGPQPHSTRHSVQHGHISFMQK